jgi:hypothetical protein
MLVPDPTARLFVVDSADDYMRLADMYPQSYANPLNPTRAPCWSVISSMEDRPFDAVHVTSGGASAVPGWDVESTLWFGLRRFITHSCIARLSNDWVPELTCT